MTFGFEALAGCDAWPRRRCLLCGRFETKQRAGGTGPRNGPETAVPRWILRAARAFAGTAVAGCLPRTARVAPPQKPPFSPFSRLFARVSSPSLGHWAACFVALCWAHSASGPDCLAALTLHLPHQRHRATLTRPNLTGLPQPAPRFRSGPLLGSRSKSFRPPLPFVASKSIEHSSFRCMFAPTSQ
jgi:hypothetical protein